MAPTNGVTAPPSIVYPTFAGTTLTATSSAVPLSWTKSSLAAAFATGLVQLETVVLERKDGFALFYKGRLNSLIGESESGKTWVALLAVVQEIKRGNKVMMVDYEDTAISILIRLTTLGLSQAEIVEQFVYIQPDEAINDAAKHELTDIVKECTLVVIDGVTEVMSIEGLKVNDMEDVATFYNRIPKWFADLGPAVVLIDHLAKGGDGKGTFAIGSQHKKSGIDGASYNVTRKEGSEFARNKHGIAYMKVAKDKNGAVRERSVKGEIGAFHLDSHGATADAWIDTPGPPPSKLTGNYASSVATLHSIVSYVKANQGSRKTKIATDAPGGNKNNKLNDIPELARNGFLKEENGCYWWAMDYPSESPPGIEI